MDKEVTLKDYFAVHIPDAELHVMLKDYRDAINPNAKVDDICIAAAAAYKEGQREFIEGIGNLKEHGVTIKFVGNDVEVDDA